MAFRRNLLIIQAPCSTTRWFGEWVRRGAQPLVDEWQSEAGGSKNLLPLGVSRVCGSEAGAVTSSVCHPSRMVDVRTVVRPLQVEHDPVRPAGARPTHPEGDRRLAAAVRRPAGERRRSPSSSWAGVTTR